MSLMSLLLPIVISAVAVFVASSILHMVLPFHKADYRGLAKEDGVRAALRSSAPSPGLYVFPYAPSMKDLAKPEMKKKYEEGPVGTVTILPNGMMNMGRTLFLWFVLCVVISEICAYVASITLAPGADGLLVLRVVATVALAAYAMGEPANSIWRGQPWSNTVRSLVDGLIYALITGGVFAWFWPAA